jgi:hypothetical protein
MDRIEPPEPSQAQRAATRSSESVIERARITFFARETAPVDAATRLANARLDVFVRRFEEAARACLVRVDEGVSFAKVRTIAPGCRVHIENGSCGERWRGPEPRS